MHNPILVTGGSGFVGANLVRRLVQSNADVHLILRKECRDWRIRDLLPFLQIHHGNLEDEQFVKKTVDEVKPATIFHLAVYGAYPHQKDVNQMLHTNILGTNNLLSACVKHGFQIFVNTGTSSEYGFKPRPSSETEWLEPNSYYAVSKASATMYCSYTSKITQLPVITYRLFSVFGPYEEPTRFIPSLITSCLAGELPPLASPKTARDYIYVEDVVDAYLLAAETKVGLGEIYNVGTGQQKSIEDVVQIALSFFDLNIQPQWNSMPGRLWDTSVWLADIHKISDQLIWKPKRSFEEGFKETILWMKKHLDLYQLKTS